MGSTRSGRDIDAALRKKGFSCNSDGKHIRYFFVQPDETRAGVNTLMSHGVMGESLSADLIARMARQLRLKKAQFLKLIDCQLDEDGYRAILDEQEE